MGALGVGGPLVTSGSWGWSWWGLVGILALFALVHTQRRRLPLFLAIAVAGVGGLILGDLTRAWGVVPVWGTLLLLALSRTLIRNRGGSQV
ncbi:MAG TPA: hypothetical protein VIC58_07100 [Actinomycetota bacterium]|jgi:hypothetical protein